MMIWILAAGFFAATPAGAAGDTVILNDGKVITGDILSLNDSECLISVNQKAERVPMTQIRRIDFGGKAMVRFKKEPAPAPEP